MVIISVSAERTVAQRWELIYPAGLQVSGIRIEYPASERMIEAVLDKESHK